MFYQTTSFNHKKICIFHFNLDIQGNSEVLHKQHKMPLTKKLKIQQFSLENIMTFLIQWSQIQNAVDSYWTICDFTTKK